MQGWECPRCHRCYAPEVKECPHCLPTVEVSPPTPPLTQPWPYPWYPNWPGYVTDDPIWPYPYTIIC